MDINSDDFLNLVSSGLRVVFLLIPNEKSKEYNNIIQKWKLLKFLHYDEFIFAKIKLSAKNLSELLFLSDVDYACVMVFEHGEMKGSTRLLEIEEINKLFNK